MPFNLFILTTILIQFGASRKDDGKVPLILVFRTSTFFNMVSMSKEDGNEPQILFKDMNRFSREVIKPSSLGIVPIRFMESVLIKKDKVEINNCFEK